MRVSIIVPVYNVERYLEECIDSILAQTHSNLEIICVDDGSTDGSPAILRSVSRRDARVKVLTKANGGLSSARNAGIREASGDVVMFVDSDDKIAANACEVVSAAFARTGAEIVTFGAECYPKELGYPQLEECLSPRDVVYEHFDMDLLFKENSRPYIWRSAFSLDFLSREGLLFPEGIRYGEDQVFHFAAYPRSRKTVLISDKLYFYRMEREGSLVESQRVDVGDRVGKHIEMLGEIMSDWRSSGMLESHEREMLQWALDVVLFDLCDTEEPMKSRLATQFACMVDESFGSADSLDVGVAAKKALREARGSKDGVFRFGKADMYRYYLESRGVRACFLRLVSILGSYMRIGRRGL